MPRGLYYSHPTCLEHDPRVHSPGHPDTPERLTALERRLAGAVSGLRAMPRGEKFKHRFAASHAAGDAGTLAGAGEIQPLEAREHLLRAVPRRDSQQGHGGYFAAGEGDMRNVSQPARRRGGHLRDVPRFP